MCPQSYGMYKQQHWLPAATILHRGHLHVAFCQHILISMITVKIQELVQGRDASKPHLLHTGSDDRPVYSRCGLLASPSLHYPMSFLAELLLIAHVACPMTNTTWCSRLNAFLGKEGIQPAAQIHASRLNCVDMQIIDVGWH